MVRGWVGVTTADQPGLDSFERVCESGFWRGLDLE
jgi:hypothetical protein